ncbi:MAG: hypothetical protein H0V56_02905 [Chthoniobacterales bacterium]|nr:hypothetical protein [Chthoniobacterales bacterium]
MNDEIINLVVQRTGISREQATTAVAAVMEFVGSKLPGGAGGQIDALIRGQTGAEPGDMMKARLGDLLGGGGNS